MAEICLDLGNDEGSLQCRGLKNDRIPNYVPLTMFPHTGVPINVFLGLVHAQNWKKDGVHHFFRAGLCPRFKKILLFITL